MYAMSALFFYFRKACECFEKGINNNKNGAEKRGILHSNKAS